MSYRYVAHGPTWDRSGDARYYDATVHEYDVDGDTGLYWIRIEPRSEGLFWYVRKAKDLGKPKRLYFNYRDCATPEGLMPYIVAAIAEARCGFELGKPPGKPIPVGPWKNFVEIVADEMTAVNLVYETMQAEALFGSFKQVGHREPVEVTDSDWNVDAYRLIVANSPERLSGSEQTFRNNHLEFTEEEITGAILYCVNYERQRRLGYDDLG